MNKNREFFDKNDFSQYTGEWVVICSEKLFGHGKNLQDMVVRAFVQHPDEVPFVMFIPKPDEMHIWH